MVELSEEKENQVDISIEDLKAWLQNWISKASGLPIDDIAEDKQLDQFGLSSRDAVSLSGDIEELTGVQLTATIAYQNPTIAMLAKRIIEGEPDDENDIFDATYYVRDEKVNPDELEVAVISLASRYPKGADTPEKLWDLIINSQDAVSDLPDDRWTEFLSDPEIKALVDTIPTKGGYLDDVKHFDAEFFSISPKEAENIDPQQRMALELTWEVFENANLAISNFKDKNVGVFIGASNNDYSTIASLNPLEAHPYAMTGNAFSIISNRVSYTFDFTGPSMTLDTACSSSLVAIHEAVRSLRTGESEIAVAGGVNLMATPMITTGFGQLGVLAPDGKIKAFSDDADGFNRAEGAGMVLLKRLDAAKRDGDEILAVIAGSAVNQDGHSNGLTAPNPVSQVKVLREAYHDAGINPVNVDYVEAHGTGTLLGDPIEADALGQVLGKKRADDKRLLLGSVKTNFGHMESAAGILGFSKTLLSMLKNKIAPEIHFDKPNSYIPMDAYKLDIVTEPTDWPEYSGSKVAGISGFGFGGTNAHVVLREFKPEIELAETKAAAPEITTEVVSESETEADTESTVTETKVEVPSPESILVDENSTIFPLFLSAFLPSRLRLTAKRLADWLESPESKDEKLIDIARTLAHRNHGRSRAVVFATSREDAIKGLRAIEKKAASPNVFVVDNPPAMKPVWVFSGYGSQHRKMAKQLYQSNPLFAATLDKVDELIQFESGFSIVERILDDGQTYDLETAQVGIFAIQIGLAELLRHHGAEPGVLIGHSMGEAAEAYVAGGLTLEEAVQVICVRSRIMGEIENNIDPADERNMAIVEYRAAEIKEILSDYPDLEICVYAAPTQTVVGGPAAQIKAITEKAESEGKFNHILQAKAAGHTSQADPYLGDFSAELLGIEPKPLQHGLYSSVHEARFFGEGSEPMHDIQYWVKGARHTVFFAQAIAAAMSIGYRDFVELSPNPIVLLSIAATQYADNIQDVELIHTLKRKEDEIQSVVMAISKLYTLGDTVKPETLFSKGGFAKLPPTPWIKKEYWVKQSYGPKAQVSLPGQFVALPDGKLSWQADISLVKSIDDLIAAVEEFIPEGKVTAKNVVKGLPAAGTITTLLTRNLTGGVIEVFSNEDGDFTKLAEAVISGEIPKDFQVTAVKTAAVDNSSTTDELAKFEDDDFSEAERWDPASGVSIEDHLAKIVAESMGYDIEDLPREIPLIDLGLDSLMAMRIKNRVEFEFDIPQMELQTVRDANLKDVARFIQYAMDNKEKLQKIAVQQKAEGNSIDLDLNKLSVAEIDSLIAKAEKGELESGLADASLEKIAAENGDNDAEKEAVGLTGKELDTAGDGVPPRDAPERLAYATWAVVTGKSAGGIFNPLPVLDEETAQKLADRLGKRAETKIDVDDIFDAGTIEELANLVRDHFEKSTGMVRILRAENPSDPKTPIIVFHPAGGTTVTYEPLLRDLPKDTPMYGFERVEGEIEHRIDEYYPKLKELQPKGPYVLVGWSLGGVMAYDMAVKLKSEGEEVALVGLIDMVYPTVPFTDTPAERRARMERYMEFAKTTYGLSDIPIPLDKLAEASDEEQYQIIADLVNLNQNKIPSGVIEHQRTSYLDNRAIAKSVPAPYDGKVVLYRSNKMHDGAIELEPTYANINPDGEWGKVASDLEIVKIGGDHLSIIDEPYIGKIAKDLTKRLDKINKQG